MATRCSIRTTICYVRRSNTISSRKRKPIIRCWVPIWRLSRYASSCRAFGRYTPSARATPALQPYLQWSGCRPSDLVLTTMSSRIIRGISETHWWGQTTTISRSESLQHQSTSNGFSETFYSVSKTNRATAQCWQVTPKVPYKKFQRAKMALWMALWIVISTSWHFCDLWRKTPMPPR